MKMSEIDRRNMMLGSAATLILSSTVGATYLTAATAKAEPLTGWMGIETAPKDGTKVILYVYDPKYIESKYCIIGYWEDSEAYIAGSRQYRFGKLVREEGERSHKTQRWVTPNGYHDPQPTHWMPLPDAPQIA